MFDRMSTLAVPQVIRITWLYTRRIEH